MNGDGHLAEKADLWRIRILETNDGRQFERSGLAEHGWREMNLNRRKQ